MTDASPAENRMRAQSELRIEPVTLHVAGASIGFEVDRASTGPAYFSLGVRKSGSTMLHKIVSFLATINHVNIVNVPDSFFRHGLTVADWSSLDLKALMAPGNLYIGFRSFPKNIATSDAYRAGRKLFMFRDPRDAMVSQYFSDAFSHGVPAKASGDGHEHFLRKRQEALDTNIDAWVVAKAPSMAATLLEYQHILTDANCLILRYEDNVFEKRRMIGNILDHFGWQVGAEAIDRLMAVIDVIPAEEDDRRFVRKAFPGDHVAKLRSSTIAELNEIFSKPMEIFNYS